MYRDVIAIITPRMTWPRLEEGYMKNEEAGVFSQKETRNQNRSRGGPGSQPATAPSVPLDPFFLIFFATGGHANRGVYRGARI